MRTSSFLALKMALCVLLLVFTSGQVRYNQAEWVHIPGDRRATIRSGEYFRIREPGSNSASEKSVP